MNNDRSSPMRSISQQQRQQQQQQQQQRVSSGRRKDAKASVASSASANTDFTNNTDSMQDAFLDGNLGISEVSINKLSIQIYWMRKI